MAAKYQYVVLVVVALIGGIFVRAGFLAKEPAWSNVLISIGTSVIATSIVSAWIRLSLGDPTETLIEGLTKTQAALEQVMVGNIKVIERSSTTGLVAIWSARQDLPVDAWIERLRHARGNIKFLAYAMAFLPDHPEFVSILEDRARAGCHVAVLVGDAKSKAVADREREEHENIVSRIETILNRTKPILGTPNFHLRTHAQPPLLFVVHY